MLREYIRECQSNINKDIDVCFNNPRFKNWCGSDVKVAFDGDGVFVTENWNDRRMSLFRQFFSEWATGSIHDEIIFIGDLTIVHQWDDDMNYVFIFDVREKSVFHIEWDKDRGGTPIFIKNGKSIILGDFKVLLHKMTNRFINTETY